MGRTSCRFVLQASRACYSTFGAVAPRQRPEDMAELRRQFEEETGENAREKGMWAEPPQPEPGDGLD